MSVEWPSTVAVITIDVDLGAVPVEFHVDEYGQGGLSSVRSGSRLSRTVCRVKPRVRCGSNANGS